MSRTIVVPLALVAFSACGAEQARTLAAAPAPEVSVASAATPAASSAAPATPPPPAPPWDITRAPRVMVNARALGPIGEKPARMAKLREIERAPGWGEERPPPPGPEYPLSTIGMPKQIDGADPRHQSLSNGKVLTTFGAKVLLVGNASTGVVEQLLMMDSPELPLSDNERDTDNLGGAAYSDGTVFLCREWNGKNPKTARRVDAIDVATGSRRWISAPETCDDVQALGEYVVTVRGPTLKILRRHDGVVAQSVVLPGRLPFLAIKNAEIRVETTKLNVTYELK